ncbi:MAG: serine/threonine protein kinase [Acidobacteria bacterium]|nr:serine/threonine protein kinase [Acidobacteriota bacterium]
MIRVAPGDKHGPYELISSIGEGGMGEVWKARDTRLDRIVALKFSKAAFSERFEREARAVAALNHPHICTLHDVGPNYLVMEFVEGTPLKGPLPLAKAIEYAAQILDALDAAHKKNITHRDLKPANVLVTKQGVKLLDFGLARHSHGPLTDTDATLTKALTTDGQILGTLQYMSPEQLQARTADARSDIFAFGCVLYELLSGKRAFSGDTAASVIAAIMEREPAAIDVSPPLDRVIKTCLAKDPDERFQTALDLKRNLLWAVDVRAETQKTPAKFPWLWAAAAAVVEAGLTWVAVRPAAQSNNSNDVYWLTILPPEDGTIDSFSGVDISPDGKKVVSCLI